MLPGCLKYILIIVLVAAIVIGAFVLLEPQQTDLFGGSPLSNASCVPSSQVVSQVSGEAGLYVAAAEGIYRYQVQQGHLTLIWERLYKSLGMLPTVMTPVVVADDEAFVAVQAASGEDIYIDALSTTNGSRRWRTTISGSEISNLFVSQHSVYLETDAPGGIVIQALDDQAGRQRWSHTFLSNNENNGYFPG